MFRIVKCNEDLLVSGLLKKYKLEIVDTQGKVTTKYSKDVNCFQKLDKSNLRLVNIYGSVTDFYYHLAQWKR